MQVINFQKASCKHCYRCVRSCSVKAIRVKNDQAQIIDEYCILCGHCLGACPQNAKTFSSDLDKVKEYLRQGDTTIVSIAPAYLGILDYDHPGQVVGALLKLGFSGVRETAEGAVYVTNAYHRMLDAGEMKNIITTCCPSVNDLVEKYYPSLTPYMAPVVSPMIAHGKMIKKIYGDDVRVVFLGPCIAKKEEAAYDVRTEDCIDAVINFEEIEVWLEQENIDIRQCDSRPMDNPDPQINRLYPVTHGILQSVLAKGEDNHYKKLFVDGADNCHELFRAMEADEIKRCFAEVNICDGGCINGPALSSSEKSRFKSQLAIEARVTHKAPEYPESLKGIVLDKQFYSRQIKEKMPTEEEIIHILKATGKYNKDQELNCSACGYATCRDKAIAVYQGKAEQEMCLPYTFEMANSKANTVLEVTPNVILIVDTAMKITEFNKKAEVVFGIHRRDALNMYLFDVMDTEDVEQVMSTHQSIHRKKYELEAYGMISLMSIVYTSNQDSVLIILQDITEEEKELEKQYMLKIDTVETAQKVIDKQMMVAQEIAGLLGETTAETKATLNRLKRSILSDESHL